MDIPEADVSGVDLEVEVLVILVYSNNFSYNLLNYLKLSVQKVGHTGSLLSLAKCSIKPYTTKGSLKLKQFDYNIYQQSSYIAEVSTMYNFIVCINTVVTMLCVSSI